jgi:protein gp37
MSQRAVDLGSVPAHIRFLSVEPFLGPIDELPVDGIHRVIVGGESGPGTRPMNAEWVESILRECRARGVAFFFKQWGGSSKASHGGARSAGARTMS